MENYLRWFAPLARVSVAVIFVMSAVNKLTDPASTLAYMQAAGVPAAVVLLYAAAFLEFFGGIGLALGWYTRVSALALLVFLIPTTLIFHDFWTMEGGAAQTQQVMFLKNLAMFGGILFFMTVGPGAISVDAWAQKRREKQITPPQIRKDESEERRAM